MMLDFAPLLKAVPIPPVSKGEWGYREWYIARKKNQLTLSVAARLCKLASIDVVDLYPDLQSIEVSYEDGVIYRTCSKCGNQFEAKQVGTKGAPRTRCVTCPLPTKQCRYCKQVFQGIVQRQYCGQYCRSKAMDIRLAEKYRHIRHASQVRTCTKCQLSYTTKVRSKSKFCDSCRKDLQGTHSGYTSPYPMCAGCGNEKQLTHATCGSLVCKQIKKTAKHSGSVYGITAEEVMVLRACPRCDACKVKFTDEIKRCIDHCHTTGKVRGVLCGPCNTSLGFAQEDPDRLRAVAAYIEATG